MSEVKAKIIFTGIPIPPSSNGQYATVMMRGRPMRVPSREFKEYKKSFAGWVIQNKQALLEARGSIREWNSTLEIAMYCCFEKSRLITLDGRCKSLDISNRSKALHDLISDALQIDDSIFVSTPMEKVIAPGEKEQVIIMLRPFNYRLSEAIIKDLL